MAARLVRVMVAYAELFCQSAHSFREGASLPSELLERAEELGISALGICDRAPPTSQLQDAPDAAVRPLFGALLSPEGLPDLVVYAMDREGARRLRSLSSPRSLFSELLSENRGLLALIGGVWQSCPEAAEALADALGDRLYLYASRLLRAGDAERIRAAESLASRLARPVLAVGQVLLHDASRQPVQDVLTCLRHGVTLDGAGRLLEPNAERRLKSPQVMERLFRDRPSWVYRTVEVAERFEVFACLPERAPLWMAREALAAAGEVIGLPPDQLETLSAALFPAGGEPLLRDRLAAADLDRAEALSRLTARIAADLQCLPAAHHTGAGG